MYGPEPQAVSRQFSHLINCQVSFTETVLPAKTNVKQVYGVYSVFPSESTLIVKADLVLLGSLAGAFVGLPDAEITQRLRSTQLDEVLEDAINEILNVAAGVITRQGRAVFSGMASKVEDIQGAGALVVAKPNRTVNFNVVVQGYQGGRWSVLLPE